MIALKIQKKRNPPNEERSKDTVPKKANKIVSNNFVSSTKEMTNIVIAILEKTILLMLGDKYKNKYILIFFGTLTYSKQHRKNMHRNYDSKALINKVKLVPIRSNLKKKISSKKIHNISIQTIFLAKSVHK